MLKKYWSSLKENNHWLVIIAGSLVWSLTMFKSGLVYKFGMGFWGPNGHDGVWHISLIQSLSSFSLNMPVFAGESLKNYHIGFDLILAIIHSITRIPISILYFQIIPPFVALGIGYFVYRFVLIWSKDKRIALWSIFFVYFGSSFGLRGESMFWAQQSISTLINPPFALSLFIMFFILYRLTDFSTKTTSYELFAISFLTGSLAFVKIYAAILFLPGLFIASLIDNKFRKLFVLSVLFSLLFYLPFNRGASSLIVFQPFWFLENMLGLSDRFFWPKLYQAMIVYKTTRNLFKFIPAYGLAAAIFIAGNLGTRLIALLNIKKIKPDIFTIILLTSSLLGFLIPLFFIQQGTPWNTIQFFYYTQIFIGLFAARAMPGLHKLIKVSIILIALFGINLTLKHYLPANPPAKISTEELTALKALSRLPQGATFTPPAVPDAYAPAPRPLYLYESTAYVSAFSGQPVYVEDTVNLNITGFDWQNRIEAAKYFMTDSNLNSAREFLTTNNISYIYLSEVAKTRPVFSASELGGKVIFENSQAAIWQIK